MEILLTGANGFIGKNILEGLGMAIPFTAFQEIQTLIFWI